MAKNTTLTALLDAYKQNEISESELDQLDKLLIGALMYNHKKQDWQNLLADNGIAKPEEKVPKPIHSVWQKIIVFRPMIFRMAAAILLLICATWWLSRDNTPANASMALLDKNLQEVSMLTSQTRMDGGNKATEEHWEAARNAIADKKYTD